MSRALVPSRRPIAIPAIRGMRRGSRTGADDILQDPGISMQRVVDGGREGVGGGPAGVDADYRICQKRLRDWGWNWRLFGEWAIKWGGDVEVDDYGLRLRMEGAGARGVLDAVMGVS
jgi:hypothetical protein